MSNFHENLQNLPKLPVPKLKDTLRKYISSIKPLVKNEMLRNTIKLVEEFECSETALKLQQYIKKRAEEQLNWFDEWFLNARYLGNRLPTALYNSPAQMLPLETFNSEDDRLGYSTKLIVGALSYKMLIDSKKLPIDKTGNTILDMSQYSRIFATCRIPSFPSDKQQFYPDSEHIIIAYKNEFYKLQLLYNSKPLSEKQIFTHLKTIVSQQPNEGVPIGILTTAQRDNWATAYPELLKQNFKSIIEIESSLFLVCLDKPVIKNNLVSRLTKAGEQLVHGDGSNVNSGNRWFDKTIQFIVGHDGISGIVFEHSFCDGQHIANMANYLHEFIQNGSNTIHFPDNIDNINPVKLTFQLSDCILNYIKEAEDHFNRSVDNSDIEWFKFERYGKEYIKSINLSPDSYVQIAIQLAFYRLYKKPAISYEPVSTRKYAKGRTESLRCFSAETISFSKVMVDSTTTNTEKLESLRLAVNTHKRECIAAADGFGTERHFLGLNIAAKEMGVETPSIFLDSSYIITTTKRLATSQVRTTCDALMGFGTRPIDLYAICYNLRDFDINFSIYSFKSNLNTNSQSLKNALILSLGDMKGIVL